MSLEQLITDNIDTWTSTVKTKSASGRGSSKKLELYGVKKLRELILELAVRGKLVQQDPSEEPASVLLERIAEEKAQLVKEKKIKKSRKYEAIDESSLPFDIPSNWEWARIEDLGHDLGQKKPDQTFTYVDVGSINKELGFIEEPSIMQASEAPSRARKLVKKNTVIYSTIRPYLLNIAVIDRNFSPEPIASTAFAIVHPLSGVSSSYIYRYLRSPSFIEYVESVQTGVAYPAINDKQFFYGLIPVPPTKEQHRIVAKVDELMTLCDQLEQQTEASIEAHQVLVTTLLDTLTNATNAEDLMQNWERIAEHFDTLFTTIDSIDQLKQTILQLAVMGKLVPQDPFDEPAAKLLERIAQEKQKLIKEKKIKKQKALPPIADDEKPFELPNGWGFAHMQDLCELITDGTHQTPKYTETGRPFISAQCVKPFRFMPENCRYVSEEHYQAYIKNRNPEFRDILLSRVGAGIGEAAMIDTELEFAIYVSTGLLKPHKSFVMAEYLVLWLNSPLGRGFSERNTLGKGVSQGNLNLSLIRAFVVSLPPLEEQQRIVDQVTRLNDLCSLLLERLQIAQVIQLNLTDAIVEKAV